MSRLGSTSWVPQATVSAASLVGQPDIGLVGYAEMLERSRTIINAVKLPVDVDVDTGYGNAMNVYWTVQNFARVGAAGVRVEDQEWPKTVRPHGGKEHHLRRRDAWKDQGSSEGAGRRGCRHGDRGAYGRAINCSVSTRPLSGLTAYADSGC